MVTLRRTKKEAFLETARKAVVSSLISLPITGVMFYTVYRTMPPNERADFILPAMAGMIAAVLILLILACLDYLLLSREKITPTEDDITEGRKDLARKLLREFPELKDE